MAVKVIIYLAISTAAVCVLDILYEKRKKRKDKEKREGKTE